ncbi:TPA: hypothetical protein ACH3X1_005810 [Trebouxia sp. C0004]
MTSFPFRPAVVSAAGAGIFGIVLAALILLTGVALLSFTICSKWKNSYARYQAEPEAPKFMSNAVVDEQNEQLHST